MTSTDRSSPYAALEEKLGYIFRTPTLCETALTHRSWLNETHAPDRSDNERLEFLGDSVLALAISDMLMHRYPEHPEGELSKARSALVNEAGLARVSDSLLLGQWIFLGRGEEQAGGRQKRSLLSNALEALVGAVYLDGGFVAAFGVVERLFQPVLADNPATTARDFKSRLQEISQARLQLAPKYTLIAQHGPDHDKTFEVAILLGDKEYGRARGKSKKEAQQNAAELAMARLEIEGQPDSAPT
ncbi:MAG TPA: ribonuclease III [Polyangia bacterium]